MDAKTLNPNDKNLSADKLLSGIITVDVGGRITYANNEAAQIFNLPVKQLTTKKIADFQWKSKNGKGIDNSLHQLSDALNTGNIKKGFTACVYINSDSDSKWLNIDVIPRLDQKQNKVLNANIILNDITDKIKAEQTNKNLKKRDLTFRDKFRGMIYRCNINKQLTPEYISREAKKLTGYAATDIMQNPGLLFDGLIHPVDKRKVSAKIKCAINKNNNFSIKYRIVTAKGTEKFVINHGRIINNKETPVSLEGYIEDITEEKILKRKLEHKLRIEKTISNITSNFIGLYNLDDAINRSFAEIGKITNADRIYLFLANSDGKTVDNTHEWCATGVLPHKAILQDLPIELFPWWTKKVMNNEIIKIENISSLPEEADAEKKLLEIQNIKSLIALPLNIDDTTKGFVGFDYVKDSKTWSKEDLTILKTLVNIFSNALIKDKIEKSFLKSEKKFRSLFEDDKIPKVLLDPETGNIIDANKAAFILLGREHEELLEMNLKQISISSPVEIFQRLKDVKNNKNLNHIFKARLKDGSLKYIEAFSSLIEIENNNIIHAIFHDITESKNIEGTLKLFKKVIEQSPGCIFIADKDGFITYSNPMLSEVSGYPKEEINGKKIDFLLSDFQDNNTYKNIWKTINSGKNWSGEILNKKKNNEFYWEKINISPIITNDEITHFVGIKEDITKNKKNYQELIQSKKKAEESDRLKSSFLATINHELRTPLNSVIGFSEIIKDTTTEPETAKSAKIIYDSGLDLLEIINDIIDLSVIDNFKIKLRTETFKLELLFHILKKQLQELLQNADKENLIELKFNADPGILDQTIIADKGKIIQIMLNLSKNAVKFTDSGTIELGIKQNQNRNFSFYIKDTGIGISKNQQNMIFDIFRQVDDTLTRKYEGVGIGLAISNKIANTLKGNISVQSDVGKGSTFTLSIPAGISTDKNEITPEYRNGTPDLTGINILVVDDDRTNLLLVEQILQPTGATIYKAKNGKEAIDFFEKGTNVNLVLMDMKMPVLNGMEATKIIKSNYNYTPVIALTAYSYEEKKAVEAGCEVAIAKPLNKKELYNLLVKTLHCQNV